MAGNSDALSSSTPITLFTACNPDIILSRTYTIDGEYGGV